MYTPQSFLVEDEKTIFEFIDNHPFAIMVGSKGSITHLPLYRFSDGTIYGHFAAANPHSQEPNGAEVTAIFNGPHAYISPRYYKTDFNVPTWNYSSVHCKVAIQYIDDQETSWDLLNQMVAISEGDDGWKMPDEPKFRSLIGGIRFFRLVDTSFIAKFKFNQNKKEDDINSVISHLRSQNPSAAEFMAAANKLPHPSR